MDAMEQVLLSAAVGALFGIAGHWITARISTVMWVAQERWKLKAELYRELLESLHELASVGQKIEIAESGEHQTKPGSPEREALGKDYIAALDEVSEHGHRLEQSLTIARIWLSVPTITAVQAVFIGITQLKSEKWGELAGLANGATRKVTEEARRDLRLDL